jgi:hypothetical protein
MASRYTGTCCAKTVLLLQSLAELHGVQGIGGSNPLVPTNRINELGSKLYVTTAMYIRQNIICAFAASPVYDWAFCFFR